jgi:hypothetical protein
MARGGFDRFSSAGLDRRACYLFSILKSVRRFDGQVIVADTQEKKLALAERFGAATVNISQQPLIEAVRDLTNGERVECLIDACGNSQLFEQVPFASRVPSCFMDMDIKQKTSES